MNSDQIALVQTFLTLPELEMPLLTDLMYARWLQLEPGVRVRLPLDLNAHKHAFHLALRQEIQRLSETATNDTSELAQFYNQHEFSAHEFLSWGAALLWTLNQALGERFTPDLADAWFAFYMQFLLSISHSEQVQVAHILSPPVFEKEHLSVQKP